MAKTPITTPVTGFHQETNQFIIDTPIGTTGEYIEIHHKRKLINGEFEEKNITLQDFYDNWDNFKNNNAFMYHGRPNTARNEVLSNQVKFWYDPNF